MEDWQLDFEWLRVRNFVKNAMGSDKLPDLQAILLLIGVQETQQIREEFTKEEKQDLMHVAVCTLLALEGHYALEAYDEEGWPHFRLLSPPAFVDIKAQEYALKRLSIRYFDLDQHEHEQAI